MTPRQQKIYKNTHTHAHFGHETKRKHKISGSYSLYAVGTFMAFVFYIGPKNSYGQKKQNPTFWLRLFLLTKKEEATTTTTTTTKTKTTLTWKSEATDKARTIVLVPNDSRIWMRFLMSFWINGFGFLTLLHALPIQIASQSSMLGIVFRAVGMIFLVDMDDVKGQAMTVVENNNNNTTSVKAQEEEEDEDYEKTITPTTTTMTTTTASSPNGGLLDDEYDRTSNVFFREVDVEGVNGSSNNSGGSPEDALEIEKQRIIEEAMIDVRRKIEDLVRHGAGGHGRGGGGGGQVVSTNGGGRGGGGNRHSTRRIPSYGRSRPALSHVLLQSVHHMSPMTATTTTTTQPSKKTALARNV
jgi:hypothetical protein